MYKYGVVGNCHVNALIGESGSVDWLCFPQPDSPPVFGQLLDPAGGQFQILSADTDAGHGSVTGVQSYITNTNILETTFTQASGAQYKITDFCPRFENSGRMYRPPTLIRIVTPLKGTPVIRVTCTPVDGWSKQKFNVIPGNSHVRFGDQIRLTTNLPLTYLNSSTHFLVHEPTYFALTWGVPIEGDIKSVCENFLKSTEKYWLTWVKHCSIPTLYQEEVIRSALVLKLHCFEDTGAILASLTTSLPEEPGSVRNWDYRCCWLRDAYFSLTAFHNLGQFEEMEGFLRWMLHITSDSKGSGLHPVYCLDGSLPLPEISHENWDGYLNSKPVRSGNEAATHVQNDVYGEAILCIAPIFLDERFVHLRNSQHRELLVTLANQCISSLDVPDAGVWEFRSQWKVHSFSTLLSWAGLERVERVVKLGLCQFDLEKLMMAKKRAEELLLQATVDGSVRNAKEDPSFDASLAIMGVLRYDKNVSKKTVEMIYENLTVKEDGKRPAFFYRYLKKDDFGKPKSAFLACSYWAAMAFASVGEKGIAREILERTFEARNHLGLYPEHFEPTTRTQLGNFPQTYSHEGMINTAFLVSPPWSDVL